MTNMTDDLFSTSWQLDDLQLYNWGVYTGDHHIALARAAGDGGSITVIGGASGVGKSAVLDAYTLLTQSRRNRLNRASGSARRSAGAEGAERTPASYVLGELKVREGEHGARPVYLRRSPTAQQAAWGAIRACFVSSMGQRLSFAQFIYVPADETKNSRTVYVVSEDEVDCALAAKVSSSAFTPASIRSVYGDALLVDDSPKAYRDMMHKRLGTDERSERLSYMMQSGWVSGGFGRVIKDMVIEMPETIDYGAKAAEQAEHIERENEDVVLRAKRRRAFEEIRRLNGGYLDAREHARAYGSWTRSNQDPADRRALRRWFCDRAQEDVEQDVEATKADLESAERQVRDFESEILSAEREGEEADKAYRCAGGDIFSATEEELKRAEDGLRKAESNHAEAERAFAQIGEGVSCETSEAWEKRKAALARAYVAFDSAEAEAARGFELDQAKSNVRECECEVKEAKEALDLARRGKRIKADMAHSQERLAEVTGMDVRELPYLAELIDIDGTQNERWREALNIALAKDADTILVTAPEREFRRVVDASDPKSYGRRITYKFISEDELARTVRPRERKTGWLSSILKVDEASKLADWIMAYLADASHDYLLVENGDFSRAERRQLSIKGQTKNGSMGRYGRGGKSPDFIGFASEDYIAARAEDLARAEARLHELVAAKHEVEGRQRRERAERDIYLQVKRLDWEAVSVENARGTVDAARARLELLSSGDLGRLRDELDACKRKLGELQKAKTRAEDSRDNARKRLEGEAEFAKRLGGIRDAQADVPYVGEELSRAFSDAWEEVFFRKTSAQAVGELMREGGTETYIGQTEKRVRDIVGPYGAKERQARSDLEAALLSFKERFPDVVSPDTGTDAADAGAYLAKFVEGECDGTTDRASWIVEMVQSLNGFVRFVDEYEAKCKSSFKPVNEILAEHPFNDLGDVLSIEADFTHDHEWKSWIMGARHLIGAYAYVDPEEFRRRPEEEQLGVLSEVIGCLKKLGAGKDGRTSTPLNDPRMRFTSHITVRPQDGSGRGAEVIGSTSGMNGGKAEKTIAFVLAAVISCTLGMSRRGSLSYAPLAIDEAFAKSDGNTTSISFETLRRFGFQLLVAVPEEKLATLEALCDRFYYVDRANEESPSSLALLLDRKSGEGR